MYLHSPFSTWSKSSWAHLFWNQYKGCLMYTCSCFSELHLLLENVPHFTWSPMSASQVSAKIRLILHSILASLGCILCTSVPQPWNPLGYSRFPYPHRKPENVRLLSQYHTLNIWGYSTLRPTTPSSTKSNLPLWQCHVVLVPCRMWEGTWEFPGIYPGKKETRQSCFTPCSLFLSLSTQ